FVAFDKAVHDIREDNVIGQLGYFFENIKEENPKIYRLIFFNEGQIIPKLHRFGYFEIIFGIMKVFVNQRYFNIAMVLLQPIKTPLLGSRPIFHQICENDGLLWLEVIFNKLFPAEITSSFYR